MCRRPKAMRVANARCYKMGSQIYDRNLQYEVFAFRRDQNGTPDYYWDGVLIKDSNVLTTGHLWLNSDVWLYNEYVSFRGISPSTHAQRRGSGLRTADAHCTTFKWEATRLRAIASIAGRYPEGCI